jgi:hypothetical protein
MARRAALLGFALLAALASSAYAEQRCLVRLHVTESSLELGGSVTRPLRLRIKPQGLGQAAGNFSLALDGARAVRGRVGRRRGAPQRVWGMPSPLRRHRSARPASRAFRQAPAPRRPSSPARCARRSSSPRPAAASPSAA